MPTMITGAWDKRFGKEGKIFNKPHEDMPELAALLRERGAKTVLDLGSGSGRHLVFFARRGFAVYGLDNSPAGTTIARKWLKKERLSAFLCTQEMTEKLPYEDSFFDAVISVQVIHHACIAMIRKIVSEIGRITKKDGCIFLTVPSLRNQGKSYRRVEPRTFIPLDGPEKGLPHHYFTLGELRRVCKDFRIEDIHIDSGDHYCLSAFKR